MPRFALLIEYDGSRFVGWQRQAAGVSIQQVLEEAAARLVGGAQVRSIVAGRTDAGVHAEGQVASLDIARDIEPKRLADALNFHMKPHPIVVLSAALAPPDWNPRFSAVGREYRYVILDRRTRPALAAGRVWHISHRLNEVAMNSAAQLLLGRHDFTSFRASACQAKSPVRTLDCLDVSRVGDQVVVRAAARSFLHHQVRNMVGTLKLVGDGHWPVSALERVLAAKDRAAAGPTAPADGLALVAVRYPVDPFSCVA